MSETADAIPLELQGNALAVDEWRRLVPMLRATRVLTEGDRSLLLALCQQWSRYLEAQQKASSLGMVVKGPNDAPMINPYLTVADKALAHCHRMWVELGLTPASRSKIAALPAAEAPKSKWAGILS